MAREETGVKVSTPVACKAQHTQVWKLASAHNKKVSLPTSEVLEGAPGLECSGVQNTFLRLMYFSPPRCILLHMHTLRCLLVTPPGLRGLDHSCIQPFNRHLMAMSHALFEAMEIQQRKGERPYSFGDYPHAGRPPSSPHKNPFPGLKCLLPPIQFCPPLLGLLHSFSVSSPFLQVICSSISCTSSSSGPPHQALVESVAVCSRPLGKVFFLGHR